MRILTPCLALLLSACVSIQQPVRPPASDVTAIEVVKHFPEIMPKGSARFEETQLFFVHADQASEFAASLLIPIPFVTDMVVEDAKNEKATSYETAYHNLSLYEVTLEELRAFDGLSDSRGGYRLYPMMFMADGYDGVYRLSMSYQVERGGWMGRYYFHLPATIPRGLVGVPPEELLEEISLQMRMGARRLLSMINRDIRGELNESGQLVTVGSLYIVGGKVGGLVNAEALKYRRSELVEENAESVIVRIQGDPTSEAKAGGLSFGVHFFYRDQMHAFEIES